MGIKSQTKMDFNDEIYPLEIIMVPGLGTETCKTKGKTKHLQNLSHIQSSKK